MLPFLNCMWLICSHKNLSPLVSKFLFIKNLLMVKSLKLVFFISHAIIFFSLTCAISVIRMCTFNCLFIIFNGIKCFGVFCCIFLFPIFSKLDLSATNVWSLYGNLRSTFSMFVAITMYIKLCATY